MIKGAPATAEATAIPGASATTEIQNYPASDSDPSGASDVVLLCQITGSDPASLDHWRTSYVHGPLVPVTMGFAVRQADAISKSDFGCDSA